MSQILYSVHLTEQPEAGTYCLGVKLLDKENQVWHQHAVKLWRDSPFELGAMEAELVAMKLRELADAISSAGNQKPVPRLRSDSRRPIEPEAKEQSKRLPEPYYPGS